MVNLKKKKIYLYLNLRILVSDNFSGVNKFDIKNLRSLFKIKKIEFSKQKIKFEKKV